MGIHNQLLPWLIRTKDRHTRAIGPRLVNPPSQITRSHRARTISFQADGDVEPLRQPYHPTPVSIILGLESWGLEHSLANSRDRLLGLTAAPVWCTNQRVLHGKRSRSIVPTY